MTWRGKAVSTLMVLMASAASAETSGPPYPRLANIYLHGAVREADIPQLARWDLLILDSVWTSRQLQLLRSLNPGIKIFYYVCPYCVRVPPNPADVWRYPNYEYARTQDMWWRNVEGGIASDWSFVLMANITESCPRGPLGNWREFMTQRVQSLVGAYPELDGVFFDNYWKTRSWQQGILRLDSDCNPSRRPQGCDGVPDTPSGLDSLWNRALRQLARETRQRFDFLESERGNRSLAILSNGAADYFPWLNGTLYEYFPSRHTPADPGNPYGYNWNHEMFQDPSGYLEAPFSGKPYTAQILNADWRQVTAERQPIRSADFERHKRFTLCSALLGDGYYSLDAGALGHGNLWWEPEYDNGGRRRGYLGQPRGPARRIDVPLGSELLQNGEFAFFQAPWQVTTSQADASFDIDHAHYRSPLASARVTVREVREGGFLKLSQSVPVAGGFAFTLRFWARSSVPGNILVHLYSPQCPSSRCLEDRSFRITDRWQPFEVSFVSSGSTNAGLNLLFKSPGTYWVDDVSLRSGDNAVYRRDFDYGSVFLNYTNVTQRVQLEAPMFRLSIPGSVEFDGRLVREENLAPSDGRILLREVDPTSTPEVLAGEGTLFPNEPNPFNPSTRIRFLLPAAEHARVEVLDVAGRVVRVLADGPFANGVVHELTWDGTDAQGRRAASGIYLCRLRSPSFADTRKMTLLE